MKLVRARSVVLATVVAMSAAACSGGTTDDPDTAPGNGTATTTAPSKSGTETTANQATGTMTIAVWTGPEAEALKAVAPEFTAVTGIDVTIDEVSRDSYRTRATTIVLGGQPDWDVFWLDSTWLSEMVLAGGLEPIGQGLDPAVFEPLGGLDNLTLDGEVYGIPTEYHSQYLYYRTDALEAAGLEVPETWEDYYAVLEELTSPDQYGGVIRAGGGGGNISVHFEFSNFFLGFGGEWLDDDGRPAMNSPAGVAALEYFVSLYEDGLVPPDSQAVGYLEKNQYYQTGTANTMIQWTAGYEETFDCDVSPTVCETTGLALIPGRRENGEIQRGALASINAWVIPAGSEQQNLGYQFLEWIASLEGAKTWALNGGTPGNQDALVDPEVVADRPDYEILLETLEFAEVAPQFPETPDLLGVWADNIAQAVAGNKSPQQALDDVAAEWERILTEGGHLQ